MASPTFKLFLSTALFSAWLFLLLVGWTFGGAVYLLFFAALILFPWKSLT